MWNWMVSRQQDMDRCSLMGYISKQAAVERTGRDGIGGWNPIYPQLASRLLIHDAGIGL